MDEQTGFVTRNILCAQIKTVSGEIIGVVQALNKEKGRFTKRDLGFLVAMTTQAATTLQSTQMVENMRRDRATEMQFLDVVSDVTAEIDLGALLQKVMSEATAMLKAERSTLFLNDEKTNELFSRAAQGGSIGEIRLPNHLGIAGAVFASGMLNKRGGPFTGEDESRLKAFTAQVSIALENAKLFDDVQTMKNYNESMLESMSNGVITMDDEGVIVTCNTAGLHILKVDESAIIGASAKDFFAGAKAWILEKIDTVNESQEQEIFMDADVEVPGDEEDDPAETVSANITILPLVNETDQQKKLGALLMIEDISSEKRMKSTMSRYMDPGIAEQMLAAGENVMGGTESVCTVLFSDVRSFTTLTEKLGPQGTVSLLNEYFTLMVDCIQAEDGVLDKFIGDAIMAAFGIPVDHGDDEDRAVRAALKMLVDLREWNDRREAEGQMRVEMGVGLNTDFVVSGNIGSPKRMDYTLIGDGVSLAARLESACKQYSAKLLISEFTYAKLKGTYRAREIDYVIVKGKTEPVGVVELLDYHTDDSFPNLMDAVNYFREGIMEFRKGNWDKSIGRFKEVLGANPNDALSHTYIERNETMKKKNPKDWNGVWVMTSK